MSNDVINGFAASLRYENMSPNTVSAYVSAARSYYSQFSELNKRNVLAHRKWLIDNFRPKTVNLRILAVNRLLDYCGKRRLRVKGVREQQVTYLENVISNADYEFFKTELRKEKNLTWYFAVRFFAATGARLSELLYLKVEHIAAGYFDIYTKGSKMRRIYIPKALREEAIEWLAANGRCSGYVFLNQQGKRITGRGIATQLKTFARRYGLNEKVVHPHSFRHLFAKNFLDRFNDISLLADLMGHESIETTRVYLRRSSLEQMDIVDKVITW